MTNERNQGIPGHAGRHAGAPAQGNNPRARAAAPQPGHAQKASMTSQLSQALPMLEVDEMAAPMGAPVITFDHVTKTYPAQPKKPALSDVTLQIFAGEFIFLVGHSGSGKSTFIRLLTREIKPTSGKIYVADEDLTTMRNWRVPYLRRNIGCSCRTRRSSRTSPSPWRLSARAGTSSRRKCPRCCASWASPTS